jgi:hypothetical protein
MRLIVTDGDRILCEDCYDEQLDEQDPATHAYANILYGVCSCCGLTHNTPTPKEMLP